jgi:hypothetical protein
MAPVKPVPESVIALRIIRKATKMLATFSAALAAFLILLGGILTLFELRNPSLNGIIPAVVDLGIFFFGVFIGVSVVGRMAGVAAPRKKGEK